MRCAKIHAPLEPDQFFFFGVFGLLVDFFQNFSGFVVGDTWEGRFNFLEYRNIAFQ
jgi:hypothetical protein